jgi:uncharacterized protein YbjT (DUF2867 family)
VHALGVSGSFAEEEQEGARVFAAVAGRCGVRRIVYLGGIVHDDDVSEHLASRREVGAILRGGTVPAIEFRASIVIGDGSSSFELVRDLVERLPAMVAPSWLDNPAQPIALDDLVEYLVAAIDVPIDQSAIYEVGGSDRTTYRELVDEVARQLGRDPIIVTVPAATPVPISVLPEALTGLLPERARLAGNLIESMRYDTAVRDDSALTAFTVQPRGLSDAVTAALAAA